MPLGPGPTASPEEPRPQPVGQESEGAPSLPPLAHLTCEWELSQGWGWGGEGRRREGNGWSTALLYSVR